MVQSAEIAAPMPDDQRRRFPYVKIALGVLAVAAIVVLFRVLPVGAWLTGFRDYVRGLGALGYLLYIVVYALCCVFFIPASVLTLGAGGIFGVIGGSVVVIIGA